MNLFQLLRLHAFLSVTAVVIHGQCVQNSYVLRPEDTQGVLITTPGYPDELYPNNEELCWFFTAVGSNVTLEIPYVDIEFDDFLEISELDGSGEVGEQVAALEGKFSDLTYVSSVEGFYVRFTSDFETVADGFEACACATEAPSCTCSFLNNGGTNWSGWSSWSGTSNWSSWYGFTPESSGLPLATKIGLGVGIPLIVLIPIIIGVSVACCAKTTKNRNSYASQRQAAAAAGVPVTYNNAGAKNQVAPANGVVRPPSYMANPPAYNGQQQPQGGVVVISGNVPGPAMRTGGPPPTMYPATGPTGPQARGPTMGPVMAPGPGPTPTGPTNPPPGPYPAAVPAPYLGPHMSPPPAYATPIPANDPAYPPPTGNPNEPPPPPVYHAPPS